MSSHVLTIKKATPPSPVPTLGAPVRHTEQRGTQNPPREAPKTPICEAQELENHGCGRIFEAIHRKDTIMFSSETVGVHTGGSRRQTGTV